MGGSDGPECEGSAAGGGGGGKLLCATGESGAREPAPPFSELLRCRKAFICFISAASGSSVVPDC